MTRLSNRIFVVAVAAVAVLGTAGVALAATGPPARPSYGLEEAALDVALSADPDPAATGGGGAQKRQEMQACVKPKVQAGTDRKTAVRECADQLGIRGGGPGKPGKGRGHGKAAVLGRAAHADLVVPKRDAEGQWETIQVDRGKVTAVSADSISLERPDGPTVTVKVVAGTKVQGVEKVTDLAVGREVVVVSAGGEARSIVARR